MISAITAALLSISIAAQTPPQMTTEEIALCEAAAQAEVNMNSEYYYADLGEFEITAYCACAYCCGSYTGMTASGTVATEGRTIGVDAGLIPLGSTVRIEFKNGEIADFIAEDTGSAIKGNIIDLYKACHSDALQFGRQTCHVWIKEKNDGKN